MAENTKKEGRNQVMYSIYVRNHSEEGTFRAVIPDLPRIRAMGVDIIWLMPIHPIGLKERKGTLGSPYAIQDYRKVNPELGSMDDFRELVDEIHRLGMKCIIDVVYNHTSPDSWLAENHREFFKLRPDGSLGSHNDDWKDIADLDYENRELWEYQIDTLKMWSEIADGFRCDVASLVPQKFWEMARQEVAKVNPECFWLSESVEPGYILENRFYGRTCLSDAEIFQAFDAAYEYDIYHLFLGYLEGRNTLEQYVEGINSQEFMYPDNYVKLRFLENHDRARIAALIPDEQIRRNWTAFLYFQKGMTLLYAGQEVEDTHTPDLFHKDTVNWNTGRDISQYLKQLYKVKKKKIVAYGQYHVEVLENQVLHAVYKSPESRLDGFFRVKGKSVVKLAVDLPDREYTNLIDDAPVKVSKGVLEMSDAPVIIE